MRIGGASLDLSAVRAKPFKWISDISWLNLVEVSKLKPFRRVLDEVKGYIRLLYPDFFAENDAEILKTPIQWHLVGMRA